MTKAKSGIREMCSEVTGFINKLDRAWHNLLQKELTPLRLNLHFLNMEQIPVFMARQFSEYVY
jgi:hypothetical protein